MTLPGSRSLPRSPWAAPLYGLLLSLLLAGSAGGHGAAVTLQELLAAGQLEIDAKLATTGTLVPGRKLILQLTLATHRWFSGGSRIQLPEVPGLVILQTEQFASNSSERRGEQG